MTIVKEISDHFPEIKMMTKNVIDNYNKFITGWQ